MQEEAKRFSDTTTTGAHDESQSSNNSQGNDPNKSRDFYWNFTLDYNYY